MISRTGTFILILMCKLILCGSILLVLICFRVVFYGRKPEDISVSS